MSKKQTTLLKQLIAETREDISCYEEEQKKLIETSQFSRAAENFCHKQMKDYYLWRLTLILKGKTVKENMNQIVKLSK